MPRPKDSEQVAALQHRALLYACDDKRRAAAMLLSAAKGFLGEAKWRATLWGAMKQQLTPQKLEEAD
jgi:hypothetical protein